MKQSEQVDAIGAALAKAQKSMGAAVKSAVNPHFKSNFADLTSVIEACREALTANEIAVLQAPMPLPRNEAGMPVYGVVLQTQLVHSSGQWIADEGLFVPAGKADAQGVGSALTYARRYGLAALVGITQADDDGNQAVASTQAAAKAKTIKPGG